VANVIMAMPAAAEAGKLFDFNLTLPIMAGEILLLMVFLDKFWFGPVGKVRRVMLLCFVPLKSFPALLNRNRRLRLRSAGVWSRKAWGAASHAQSMNSGSDGCPVGSHMPCRKAEAQSWACCVHRKGAAPGRVQKSSTASRKDEYKQGVGTATSAAHWPSSSVLQNC
jgi:hypothetical protein